ncbi:MAG: hypothetical protein H0U57_11585 [Tatlockia sp.]|nr:hypothetical protein [Tatlockia sp.]
MLNLKKAAVAVLALSSSAVFAGTMGPVCTPGNVTVPCERTAWDFGGQALYLQTLSSANDDFNNYGYGTGFNSGFNNRFDGYDHHRNFDDNWRWGFKLEGSYHFLTGNDLNVNWYHLDGKRRNHGDDDNNFNHFHPESGIYTGYAVPVDNGYGYDNNNYNRFRSRWDAINIELGQHVDFSPWKIIRFHGGAQFARIESGSLANRNAGLSPFSTTSTTSGVTIVDGVAYPNANSTMNQAHHLFGSQSRFNGFGPRVGADMSFGIGNGFGVYANGATALLVGQSKLRGDYRFNNLSLLPFNGDDEYRSRTIMVPEMEAKLGAKYTYAMAQGDLTLDAGYMWVHYWNATRNQVNRFTHFEVREGDFSLNGPFVGLKWVGNV